MISSTLDASKMAMTIANLEQVFIQIQQQRMQDVPILNPALWVEAIAFREWNQRYFGVLITPWFMNLIMLLPPEYFPSHMPKVDEKAFYQFPAGHYSFLVCFEEHIGTYHSCSLFSPMFEFDSQDLARATAQQVMQMLFESPEKTVNTVATDVSQPQNEASEKMNVNVSRRDWLRGKFR